MLYDFNFDWTLQDTTIKEHKKLEDLQDKPKVIIETDRQSNKDEQKENVDSSSNNQTQNPNTGSDQVQEGKSEESENSENDNSYVI